MHTPDLSGQHFLVLGLGESGLAMVRWLLRCGARVRVADSRPQPPGAELLRAQGGAVELCCGPFADALLDGIHTLALSPGLAVQTPLVATARARGIEVLGEIELFARALRTLSPAAKIIAITGTNGKTTTTTLAGELVRAAGRDVAVAGNISPAALDELLARCEAGRLPDVWVLELSSFQLETTTSLVPDAATVLNVTDDHLDRHGSMAAYAAEKARVFAGAGVQVLNREDAYSAAMAQPGRRAWSFGLGAPQGADEFGLATREGVRGLMRGSQWLLAADELRLAGDHNLANALAALALALAIDLPLEPMLQVLRSFRGLPHRVEEVARRGDGVIYFDDSKGTNVGATLAALQGLGRPVVLIAGGDGKGQDFRPLTDALRAHARAVVLIGRDARLIEAQTAASGVPMLHAPDLPAAVREADALACAGDAVLLSPACASMDMFRNYAHRAEVFVAAVRTLPGLAS